MSERVLAEDEVQRLKRALSGTWQNVYDVAERLFGTEVGEVVFNQLHTAGLFKCDGCDTWMSTQHLSDGLGEMCEDCAGQ